MPAGSQTPRADPMRVTRRVAVCVNLVVVDGKKEPQSVIIKIMKLYSWNVNGIRAVIKKGDFQTFISQHHPDILCLQETKAKQGQAEIDLPDYQEYWNSAEKAGYSGTAI